uniref:Ras-associating domain-containing protein n=1 Tax=Bursaphelenchus xylophilus TaxID=6326 RepID=A0A1I7S2Y5_BURXY
MSGTPERVDGTVQSSKCTTGPKKFTKLEVSPRRRSHDVASAYITRPQPKSHRRGTMHVLQASRNGFNNISFGYASSSQPVRVDTRASVSASEEESSYSEEQPSTSITESDLTFREGEFFARMPDKRIVPLSCECLSGREADVFLEALGDKNRDKIQKFLEREEPNIGEYHIWVRNDDTSQVSANYLNNGGELNDIYTKKLRTCLSFKSRYY